VLCIDHPYLGETSSREEFLYPGLGPAGIRSEAQGNAATRSGHAAYLTQSGHHIWPDLHGIDCQHRIEGGVFERQVLHRAMAQVDNATRDRFSVRALACCTISLEQSTPVTRPADLARSWMPTPGPNPTSSTFSRGCTSSRLITERANAALVRAMMMPPNLPSVPIGRPNIRIKVLLSTLIGLAHSCHLCFRYSRTSSQWVLLPSGAQVFSASSLASTAWALLRRSKAMA
jgi:hypothetical protein